MTSFNIFNKARWLVTIILLTVISIPNVQGAVAGFPVNFTTSNYTGVTVITGRPATWTSNKTLSTNSSGVFFQKQNSGAYYLFTIPVTGFSANDSVTVFLDDVKVSNNTYKMTFQMSYSTNGSSYTNFGDTWTESTTAKDITRGIKIPTAVANGTIYIKILSTSGGGTNGGNHYIKAADITYTAGGTKVTLSKAATTNGSFKLRSGSCSGSELSGTPPTVTTTSSSQTVYIDPTPNDGYQVNTVTSKLGDAAAVTVSKSGDCYPVTYAQGASGTAVITVTFACATPTFGTNLSTSQVDYTQNASASALTVAATANGGTITYQWQSSSDNSSWSNIGGATSASYTPPTTSTGTTYYHCIATNTTGGDCTATSNAAKIVVTAATCTDEYTFDYGGTKQCFSQVDETNEFQITGFTIPTTTTNYWVGYNGAFYDDNLGTGSPKAKSANNQFKYMPVANLQGQSCGGEGEYYKHAAAGAYGTLRIFRNSSADNLYIGFVPAGYQMRVGSGESWSNIQLTQSDGTVWTSDLMTLDAALIAKNYYVNVYTGANYSSGDAGVAINNWTNGGSTISSMAFKTGSDSWDTSTGLSAGMRGKFRAWSNNCANNGYCHFVPYYQLQYNPVSSSGTGTGSMSPLPATPISCEESSGARTVTVATSSFTAPQYKQFDHWNTAADNSGSNVSTGSYTLTSDVTLYAQWAYIPVTALTLNYSSLKKYVGESSVTLSVASVTPGTANPAVTWTSSDATVASVDGGVVSFLKAGTATITATSTISGGVTATCSVEVRSISSPTMQDEDGTTISGNGLSATWTLGTRTLAASEGTSNYKFKRWVVTNATPASTTNLSTTLGDPTGNVTVVAEFYKPRTVTKGTGTGTSTFTVSPTGEVKYGSSVTVTCAATDGYKNPWTLTVTPSDGATYTSSGSTSSISITNITKDITVDLAYTAKETATVKLHVAGSTSTISGTRYEGDSYTLPSEAAECPDMGLYGWYTTDYEHATIAPSGANFKLAGASATLAAGDNDFYAVYATIGDLADTYTKITTAVELTTGDYLIVGTPWTTMYAMKNAYQSSESTMADEERSVTSNQISNPASTKPEFIWHFTKSTNTITIYSENNSKYFGFTSNHVALMNSSQDLSYEVSDGKWAIYAGSDYLTYDTYFKRGASKVYDAFLFKRDQSISGPYTTSPSCVTHTLTVEADPVAGGTAEAAKTVLGETKTTTATATPNSHYDFAYWTISGTGSTMSNTSDGKSTDNPVTITMGTANATLTAHFTEKPKCTVVFKNNGTQLSSTTYWQGENPVAPTLTDGTSHDACDETSDTHYGWTQTTMPDVVPSKATIDAYTGAQTVYAKAATLPAITAGDDGTTITYHAVWAEAISVPSNEYQLVTNTNQLSIGDKVVIGSAASGSIYLLGKDSVTAASYEYRKFAQSGTFSVSNSKVTVSTLASSKTDRNNPFELTLGKSGDYWTFYDGVTGGYVCCTSTSTMNRCGYEAELSDAGKWDISITSSLASIVSQISSDITTRNYLQKNGTDLSGIFSCYSNNQTNPAIFRNLSTTGYQNFLTTCCANIVEAPEVTGTPTKNSITLSWTNVTGATGYTVTCSGGTPGDVASDGTARSCVITGLSPNTNYTWSVVATYTTPYCLANTANGNTTTSQVYAVSYNKNGGTIANLPSGGTYAAGEEVTVAAKPDGTVSKGGYTFTGWNTANDGSGEHYNADGSTSFTMPSEAVVLYAEWTAKKNYFVDRMHGNWDGEHTEPTTGYNCYLREGAGYTVPDLSDNDTGSNSCVTGHAHFVGWVASGMIDTQGGLKSGYTIIKGGTSGTASTDGTIYYAVWAEE